MKNKYKNEHGGIHPLIIVLAVCLVGLVIFYATPWFSKPDIAALTEQALHAQSDGEMIFAAQQLAQLGKPAMTSLRKVAQQSTSSDVVSVCILAISRLRDYESMDLLIAKLDDSSLNVRTAAAKAVSKLLGRDHHFPPDGKENDRARIRDKIKADWQAYNGSELFHHNMERFKDDS